MAVMLHGMCNRPEYECPHFARAITQHAWLVCPRATVTCKSGGAIWSFRDRTRSIEAAVERVKREFAGEIDESQGRTLMGFSLGAITAMALAHDASGQWRRVILIGAKTDPRPSELKKAGVERMLFVSGDYDMMRSNMVEQSRRVARAGIASTFMSLGRVGHRFPSDMEEQMARAYAWVSGPSETTEPSR
jgi:predicted esterase